MGDSNKHFEKLVSSGLMHQLLSSKFFTIAEVNAVLSLLIKYRIPFDLSYTPGTRRNFASYILIIFINPNTSLQFSLGLGGLNTEIE